MARHYPDLVPVVRLRILDPHTLSDTQHGKGTAVLVVLTVDLVSTSGGSAIAVLGAGLPFLQEGCGVGRDTGAERLAVQHLRRRTTGRGGGVP